MTTRAFKNIFITKNSLPNSSCVLKESNDVIQEIGEIDVIEQDDELAQLLSTLSIVASNDDDDDNDDDIDDAR
jgi:hypothetical protein